jgi:hypothetical protein
MLDFIQLLVLWPLKIWLLTQRNRLLLKLIKVVEVFLEKLRLLRFWTELFLCLPTLKILHKILKLHLLIPLLSRQVEVVELGIIGLLVCATPSCILRPLVVIVHLYYK